MTSGVFNTVSLDKIWVDREKRQRRELLRIPELAASIRDNGLIHPPVIRKDGELIVGERRYNAVKSLGWTHIPVQYVEDLDEVELHAIEYEENVARVDLPWQEQCIAVERYHELRQKQNPEWTNELTADALGMSSEEVRARRGVAKALDADDEKVKAAPKYSVARNIVARQTERKRASIIANAVAISVPEAVVVEQTAPLLNANFLEWAPKYEGPPFNFIHCDFPYGVNMHESDQTNARFEHGAYADSADVYWELLAGLRDAMGKVVAESAHLMFWFSMDYYHETKGLLHAMGWKVNAFPLIWFKSDNTGVIPDAQRQPRRVYETAFMASRGDRFIAEPVSNLYAWPGRDKNVHMNEKPVGMLKHFLRMFVDKYSRVLDPTCGSGNALKAASTLGAEQVLGIERDPTFYEAAKEAYYDTDF